MLKALRALEDLRTTRGFQEAEDFQNDLKSSQTSWHEGFNFKQRLFEGIWVSYHCFGRAPLP